MATSPHVGRWAAGRCEHAVGAGRRAPFQSRPQLEDPAQPPRADTRQPPSGCIWPRVLGEVESPACRLRQCLFLSLLPLPSRFPAGFRRFRFGQGSLCERGRRSASFERAARRGPPRRPACPVAAPRCDGFPLWLAHLSHRFCSPVILLAAEERQPAGFAFCFGSRF